MKKRVAVISLGCSKNLVDTRFMLGVLKSKGYVFEADSEAADIILINTCAFIQPAIAEAAECIDRACALPGKRVIVTGCLPERLVADILKKRFTKVFSWLGIDSLDKIALAAEKRTNSVTGEKTKVFAPTHPNIVLTNPAFAHLKVSDGCNNRCAFCTIPSIRGKHRARPAAEILREANDLAALGVKEINLVAQDLTAYPNFSGLLKKLGEVPAKFRLLYLHPSRVTDNLLETIKSAKNIVPYLDIPMQHSSSEILRAMHRPPLPAPLPEFAKNLRGKLPGVTLRTTLMVGYPGETDEIFEQLISDVKKANFDHIGIFSFIPEPGTDAANLPGQVPAAVANRRARLLLAVQKEIAMKRNLRRVGREVRALVISAAPPIARGEWQAPDVDGEIVLQKNAAVNVGDVVRVKLTSLKGAFSFRGKVL